VTGGTSAPPLCTTLAFSLRLSRLYIQSNFPFSQSGVMTIPSCFRLLYDTESAVLSAAPPPYAFFSFYPLSLVIHLPSTKTWKNRTSVLVFFRLTRQPGHSPLGLPSFTSSSLLSAFFSLIDRKRVTTIIKGDPQFPFLI